MTMPAKGGSRHIRLPLISFTMVTEGELATVRKADIDSAKEGMGYDSSKVVCAPSPAGALSIELNLIINLSRKHPSGAEKLELCDASSVRIRNFSASNGEVLFPGLASEKKKFLSVAVTAMDASHAMNCLAILLTPRGGTVFEPLMLKILDGCFNQYICTSSGDKSSFVWFGVEVSDEGSKGGSCSDEIAKRDESISYNVANKVPLVVE